MLIYSETNHQHKDAQ